MAAKKKATVTLSSLLARVEREGVKMLLNYKPTEPGNKFEYVPVVLALTKLSLSADESVKKLPLNRLTSRDFSMCITALASSKKSDPRALCMLATHALMTRTLAPSDVAAICSALAKARISPKSRALLRSELQGTSKDDGGGGAKVDPSSDGSHRSLQLLGKKTKKDDGGDKIERGKIEAKTLPKLWDLAREEVIRVCKEERRRVKEAELHLNRAKARKESGELPTIANKADERERFRFGSGDFGTMLWALVHGKCTAPIYPEILHFQSPRSIANVCWALGRMKPEQVPWDSLIMAICRSLSPHTPGSTDDITRSTIITAMGTLDIKDERAWEQAERAIQSSASSSSSSSSTASKPGGTNTSIGNNTRNTFTAQSLTNCASAFASTGRRIPLELKPLIKSIPDWTPAGLARVAWACTRVEDSEGARAALEFFLQRLPGKDGDSGLKKEGEEEENKQRSLRSAAAAAGYGRKDRGSADDADLLGEHISTAALAMACITDGVEMGERLADAIAWNAAKNGEGTQGRWAWKMEDLVALADADNIFGGALVRRQKQALEPLVEQVATFFDEVVPSVLRSAAEELKENGDFKAYEQSLRSLNVAFGGNVGTQKALKKLNLGGYIVSSAAAAVTDKKSSSYLSPSAGPPLRGTPALASIINAGVPPGHTDLKHVDRLGRELSAAYRTRRNKCAEITALRGVDISSSAANGQEVHLRCTQMPCISCLGAMVQAQNKGMKLKVSIGPIDAD